MEAPPGEPDKAVRKVDALMLLRLRDQMKQQLRDCSAAADTNQESDLDHVIEEGSATKDMEKDIEEKKVSFQNKTLALQRIQIMLALRNKLKQNDSDSREILKMLKHIVILSQEVIERQQQLREKEQKLTDIKMKRLSPPHCVPLFSAPLRSAHAPSGRGHGGRGHGGVERGHGGGGRGYGGGGVARRSP
ncbi:centromere protein H-like [Calypte anna]|uniref:centromere protein H-like n=1 Tax=Calypte anna TaxID=9244 RepID=UPI0011C43079|nr:centromere protein H-like [Calypte anna]